MKNIREIYPGCETEKYFNAPINYDPLLESFGYKVVLKVDDDDYQGDSRVLFKNKKEEYGYLIFGWGSCSGCDALQASSSYNDLEELQQKLFEDIKWFYSLEEIQGYFKQKDWELEYCGHSEETKKFIKSVLNL